MTPSYEVFGSLGEAGCFRVGLLVHLPHPGGELPERCVMCNAPTEGRVVHKLVFRPGEVTMMLFLAPLVGLILSASRTRKVTVHLGLCAPHRARRKRLQWLAGGAALVGLGLLIGGAAKGLVALVIVGLLLLIFVAPLAAYATRVVKLLRIDPGCLVLGCGRPFVESLPEAPVYAPTPVGYGAPMWSAYPMHPMQGPGWVIPPQQGFGGR